MNLSKLTTIPKEHFDDKLIQVVKIGISTWEKRREAIIADKDFQPKNYQRTPTESGLVCTLCGKQGIADPLKLSHIFKNYNDALATGNKEAVLKAIDDGIAEAKQKVNVVYRKEV